MIEPQIGFVVDEPQGQELIEGKVSEIIKSRRYKTYLDQEVFLIQGSQALGIIKLANPTPQTPDEGSQWIYPVEVLKRFETPLSVAREKKNLTWVSKVIIKRKEKELPMSHESVDVNPISQIFKAVDNLSNGKIKVFSSVKEMNDSITTMEMDGFIPVEAAVLFDIQKAVWTTAFINTLPDSAFLHVETGGKKDSEGKTVPRSLRHFPFKDDTGKVDLPHLRNAIARMPQSKIPGFTSEDIKRIQEKARKILEKEKEKLEGKEAQASKQVEENLDLKPVDKGTEEDVEVSIKVQIIKSNEEKRLVTGVALVPEKFDAQAQILSEEVIEEAAHDFVKRYNVGSVIGHMHKDFNRPIILVESWIAPQTQFIGGRHVKKGSWVITTKVDPQTWKEVKAGKLTGYSIGGKARVQSL